MLNVGIFWIIDLESPNGKNVENDRKELNIYGILIIIFETEIGR